MKIIQLKPEQRNEFVKFDPFFRLEWISLPGNFALAAMVEKKKAGLLICSTEKDMLVVDWMYVAPEFRKQGIGEQLLELSFEYARKKNLSKVSVYFAEYPDNIIDWGEAEGYFYERFFEKEVKITGEQIMTVGELASNEFFSKSITNQLEVKPFSSFSKVEKEKFYESLADTKTSFFEVKGNEGLLDEDICMVVLKNKKPVGAVLFATVMSDVLKLEGKKEIVIPKQETIYPVLFSANGSNAAAELLFAAVKNLSVKFTKETPIRIVSRQTDFVSPLEKMGVGVNVPGHLLIANTSDFFEWSDIRDEINDGFNRYILSLDEDYLEESEPLSTE